MLRIAFLQVLIACSLLAQRPSAESKPSGARLEVKTLSYGNTTCPLMSKPVVAEIFVDSSHGRVWFCCKNCVARAQKDPDAAYAKAYPNVTKVSNALDPISKKPVKEGVTVIYQGYEIGLSDPANAKAVCANGDIYVTLLTKPEVKDVGNMRDPLSGEPVADNLAILIGDSLVRVARKETIDAAKANPDKLLMRAQRHVQREKPTREQMEKMRGTESRPGN